MESKSDNYYLHQDISCFLRESHNAVNNQLHAEAQPFVDAENEALKQAVEVLSDHGMTMPIEFYDPDLTADAVRQLQQDAQKSEHTCWASGVLLEFTHMLCTPYHLQTIYFHDSVARVAYMVRDDALALRCIGALEEVAKRSLLGKKEAENLKILSIYRLQGTLHDDNSEIQLGVLAQVKDELISQYGPRDDLREVARWVVSAARTLSEEGMDVSIDFDQTRSFLPHEIVTNMVHRFSHEFRRTRH